MTAESALVAETLRVNARYVEEVVIGWGLCPWAAQAWREGAVARRVLVDPAPGQATERATELEGMLAFIDEIAPNPALSIGLAIFPRATLSEAAWGTFAERVRRADRARRAPEVSAPFLLAAFHPKSDGSAAAAANSGALVAFIISAFVAGLAGSFYANYVGYISPLIFDFQYSVSILIFVVVGGFGSLAGPVTGAVVLTVIPEVFRASGKYQMLIFGLILVGSMLTMPDGITGALRRFQLRRARRAT